MKCGHLLQFSVEEVAWSVTSCTGHDRPYVPSVAELREYCMSGGQGECPAALWRASMTRGYVALPLSDTPSLELGKECSNR